MTSWTVCDSNVLLATVLPEKYTELARVMLSYWKQQQIHVAAPVLLQYEIISVLRKSVVRNIVLPDHALKMRDKLLSTRIRWMLDDDLLRRAYELAT